MSAPFHVKVKTPEGGMSLECTRSEWGEEHQAMADDIMRRLTAWLTRNVPKVTP